MPLDSFLIGSGWTGVSARRYARRRQEIVSGASGSRADCAGVVEASGPPGEQETCGRTGWQGVGTPFDNGRG